MRANLIRECLHDHRSAEAAAVAEDSEVKEITTERYGKEVRR